MRQHSLVVIVCAVGALASGSLAACGGSDSASLFPPNADSGVASDAATVESDASDRPSDAGARDAAPNGVDAAKKDPRILPLALGRRWTFEAHAIGNSTTDCVGTQTAEVIGKGATREGKTSLRYQAICYPSNAFGELEGTGDRVLVYFVDGNGKTVSGPYTYLDAPVAEGHEWQYGSDNPATFAWHEVGTVTVPAGTFDDCWRRDLVTAADDWAIYCRGVGQVKHHYASDGFEAELTSINF